LNSKTKKETKQLKNHANTNKSEKNSERKERTTKKGESKKELATRVARADKFK